MEPLIFSRIQHSFFIIRTSVVRSILATLLSVLGLIQASATEPTSGRVLKYSIKDGLSWGVVNSIIQDTKGRMWVATSDGLNRFDGTTFRVFKHNPADLHSLSGNYIKSIFRDRNGTVWTSSRNGLNEFVESQERFNRYKPTPFGTDTGNDITDISQAGHQHLWLSLNSTGFARFDTKSHQFTYFNQKNLPQLSSNSVLTVLEDSQGLLWIGTRDSGIDVFRKNPDGTLQKAILDYRIVPKTRIYSIYEDRRHNIWISTKEGLVVFKRDNSTFYPLSLKTVSGSEIYLDVAETGPNTMLVGVQEGGLYRMDLTPLIHGNPADLSLQLVKDPANQGITGRSVQSLYVDKDQNIWAGTYGEGVYLLSSIPEKFATHTKKVKDAYGESNIRFYGMCRDEKGNFWIGTDGDGIYKSKPNGELLKHYAPGHQPGALKDGAVISAYRDHENNLWFGTYSQGLFRYSSATDSFQQFASVPGDPQSLSKNDVRVIFEDRRKQLWVGTNGGGLSLLNRTTGKFTNFKPSNSTINSNDVRALTQDSHGNLWIGAYGGGLNFLDTRTLQFKQFFNKATDPVFLSNHVVISLYMDPADRLWIGTEGNGLVIYDTRKKTIQRYDEKTGLASNVINAIQPEPGGRVWISTNQGLSRINPADGKIENFDQSNGLQTGQFNPGSTLYDPLSGLMCFGGTEGWNSFHPAAIKASPYQPKVMITGIQIFGEDVQVGHEHDGKVLLKEQINSETELTLEPSQSVFSILYTALNYGYPENTRFAYQLEGLDKDWYQVQNERSATYRYLPAGTYVFRVKAANQDGVWFPDYASVTIRILPPWYQTWWAYTLYASVLVALIYFYQRYRFRQNQLRYEIQLAHLETQKEKELHEKRLSFFTFISHECRTPLTLIINPVRELLNHPSAPKDVSNLTIIYRNARRLLSMMDQLLLFQKAEQGTDELKLSVLNLPELVREVYQCFLHQAETSRISYTFHCDNETLEIVADREKIEIALFNLISNALKFTPPDGSVSVRILEKDSKVEVQVEDTGVGIPPEAGAQIFTLFHQPTVRPSKAGFGIGLFLVKTYIEKHAGTIAYQSEMGKGTQFTLSLWKQLPMLHPSLSPQHPSEILKELSDAVRPEQAAPEPMPLVTQSFEKELNDGLDTLLLVDDDADIRTYLKQLFEGSYHLLEASSGEEGLEMARKFLPDLVLSDVMMGGMTGIDLCQKLKTEAALSHIPVILLTASTRQEMELKSLEGQADGFIRKPFDSNVLLAQVASILKNRKDMRKYFYNEITLQSSHTKVSPEYKEFLQDCIRIVEKYLTDPAFTTKVLAAEIGLSHSTLYNRIKSISGKSINEFIRFIRLRRAAQLLITTDLTIAETAYQVGINDTKYFREQFHKVFGMNPSEYVKKYRKPFHENQSLNQALFKGTFE